MQLQDTAALVTGGASGLGEATVRHLARQGARVAILDIDRERAGALAKLVGGLALHCDVTDPASAAEAIAAARERHGVARVLVNCAGGGKPKRVVGKDGPMPLEDFVKVVNLNLFGGFNMVRLAAADMIAAPPVDGERGVRLKYSDPMFLDDVAVDFPMMPIVIAHPSFPWQENALAVATHKPQVYIDLSGWSPKYFSPLLVQYANGLLKHKMLFGSDFPALTPERWLADFAQVGIKPEVQPLILKRNAIRLLGLDRHPVHGRYQRLQPPAGADCC